MGVGVAGRDSGCFWVVTEHWPLQGLLSRGIAGEHMYKTLVVKVSNKILQWSCNVRLSWLYVLLAYLYRYAPLCRPMCVFEYTALKMLAGCVFAGKFKNVELRTSCITCNVAKTSRSCL